MLLHAHMPLCRAVEKKAAAQISAREPSVTGILGDCVQEMQKLGEGSVDALVTDPPYGLEFMGKAWDGFGSPLGFQRWTEQWAREALRILKPGGHALVFGGTRLFHRMAVGVEDAGFDIRDCLMWLYGTGFPKSLDVSKAIDKAAGARREVVGSKVGLPGYSLKHQGAGGVLCGRADGSLDNAEGECAITAPATDAARQWQGWGTALKPAWEPIILARKPLAGTVAQNAIEHGTGALHIDACRISGNRPATTRGAGGQHGITSPRGAQGRIEDDGAGRWPANVVLDPEAARLLDLQSPDKGGVSRFFYCSKPSTAERDAGLAALPACTGRGDDGRTGARQNLHPTVKPVGVMRWLCRLVTPPGGVVLDPFMGSGSTGVAAILEGFDFFGIEKETEYFAIAEARVRHAVEQACRS